MKKNIYLVLLFLSFLSGCSVDRLALLIRQYDSGSLISESDEKLERKFSSAQKQFSCQPGKRLLVLYIEALTLKKKGENARALSIFEEIVSQKDTFLDAWLNVACLYAQLGKMKESKKAYLTCLRIIENEIYYLNEKKWPNEHILLDDHMNYAVRYAMIDNSYLPKTGHIQGKLNYDEMKKNLLNLKEKIQLILASKMVSCVVGKSQWNG